MMLRRMALFLLLALIISPVQSRKVGNDQPQTAGGKEGNPPEIVATKTGLERKPPPPNPNTNPNPPPPCCD